MITKISFSNFKLFKEKNELLLKPITVLIGKNNSGKTAVLKLPTMIAGSLKGEFNDIIKLENEKVKIGSEYRDLVYNRELRLGDTLNLELSDNNPDDSIFESLKIKIALPRDEIKDKQKLIQWEYFKNNILIQSKEETDVFKGFIKNSNPFNDLSLKIDYIEALREKPQEEYSFDSSEINKIGLKGQNAYQILIKDKVIGKGEILKKVSDWYKENFENWSIKISDDQVYNSSKVKFTFNLLNSACKKTRNPLYTKNFVAKSPAKVLPFFDNLLGYYF